MLPSHSANAITCDLVAQTIEHITTRQHLTLLARRLAEATGVTCLTIGELVDDGYVVTVANFQEGEIAPNKMYAMQGMPCEQALATRDFHYDDQLAGVPEKSIFRRLHLSSYLGAPIFGLNGRPIGVICFIHCGTLPLAPDTSDALRSLCSAVAKVLETPERVHRSLLPVSLPVSQISGLSSWPARR